MSYEMGHPKYDVGGGSGVARVTNRTRSAGAPGAQGVSRRAGTASSTRARRAVSGLSGYNDLAGSDLGFSFNPVGIIKAIAKPVISMVPGGSTVLSVASVFSGLSTGGNAKDKDRIATAAANLQKALAGDASAVAALQTQAKTSATAVGKAAAQKALDYYNANTNAHPLVTQVAAAGLQLATQAQSSGPPVVVATNPATGAVVSQPLPIPPSAVPAGAPSLPVNAVQSAAPTGIVPPRPASGGGITDLLQWIKDKTTSDGAAASNAAAAAATNAYASAGNSGGGGSVAVSSAPTTDTGAPVGVAPSAPAPSGVSPMLIAGAAAAAFLLLKKK